ncbi:MAG TPA: AAA family ATPase [Roseiarcus sp.]
MGGLANGAALKQSFPFGAQGKDGLQFLWVDGERVFHRGCRENSDGGYGSVLVVLPAAERALPATLERLAHEYALRDELDAAWAARPLALVREGGRTALLLEDPGGEPLEGLIGAPMEAGRFLRLAIGIAAALGKAHQRGLVHKDVKPANILVNCADGQTRLAGFGIASRLPRERQAPEPPEFIAGTLAYMAPEQTGRMNRSIDSRSDLYALGVTFYQMLTGRLPFSAADPMEWVHCHIARKAIAPAERLQSVPAVLSEIVMKLLAKTAEERYQTAAGIEHDLRRSLAAWERHARIEPFALGENDSPDRLMIPEKLYGREREVETLLAAFDRVVESGAPELVLVSGYSGIGKSSVVNELHKPLVRPRGLFALGKFDQYKRDIPYSTLVQAFQSLVRPLLSKSDAELSRWRNEIMAALGPNGRLMTDLIPELTLVIGEQPPVPELEAQQAQRRFQLVFRRFLSVFTKAEHPLALFLDDLQWLDAATLDLLEDLLTQADVRRLLLVGAYRDNEVDAAHPLMRKLTAIRSSGAKVSEIKLGPLNPGHVGQLIADALGCATTSAAPLSELVHAKTSGNPFFVLQFLYALTDEGFLAFDHGAQRWSWDLGRIHAKGYADNVVDLMVGKLARLPDEAQRALQQLACLGNVADITTLAVVLGSSEDEVHAALWEAVRLELVERLPGAYRFGHDRVQEAAYSLIPEEQRAVAHLRIGRLLVARTPPQSREEVIFEIVNQFNRGAALITAREEREQLAELNLLAGKRAKASTAYASALTYLTAGAALLPDGSSARRAELTFALELHRAECEFLTGTSAVAEARLAELARHATNLPDLAAVTQLRVELLHVADRIDRCVEVGLDYLNRVCVVWSARPTPEVVRQEYAQMWRQLGDRPIEALLDLPRMADPVACGTMDVLTALVSPAWHTDYNLRSLVIGRMVNVSLEHGNSAASCLAYAFVGTVLGPYFGDYKGAYRFCQLGLDLVEQPGLDRFKARVYLMSNLVNPWTRHVRTGRALVRRAFDTAQQAGDLTYAVFSQNNLVTNLLASGDPLADVQREAEAGLDFARQARFGIVVDFITTQLQLIRTLRGLTPAFGWLEDAGFSEGRFEQHLESDPSLVMAVCWYWIRALQARFFAGAYASALEAASKAQPLLWTSLGLFELPEYHLYAALTQAALCDEAAGPELARHLEALAAHHYQLQEWAENCPENFENRAALVGAEIARLEGRALDAMDLYEQAIRSARANAFIHNEALAHELAARFYAARGFEDFARVYRRKAHEGYLRWAADGKARQLEELYPHLREEAPALGLASTIGAPIESLDLATVLRVSQAVSGEIVVEKLIHTLMRTAIEQAGAVRGLLILPRGLEQRIEAEATTSGDTVIVHLRDEAVGQAVLPESVLQFVVRTRESVILDDAAAQSVFTEDTYIRERRARSILCMPLVNQGKLNGVLYLENNLARSVFAPTRIAVLKLLASQAAIALENTRLYRDLAEREAKIRRLVDANIIGIFIWDFDGRILEANDAFLRIVGYDRQDLAAARINWADLTPSDWRERDAQWIEEHKRTGLRPPIEKEYFRKDGSRAPILLAAASFGESDNEGVAFVLDLTERKEAEAALGEMQTQLAHANRVATMGQLTASIAHEVNQPIAATVTNAEAALRFLNARQPDLDEVRDALGCIVRDGERAGDVLGRIRALIKGAPPLKEHVQIGVAIREVIELTRSEAMKNGVLVQTELVEDLPPVQGDRVELQQVILNLILNAIEAMSGTNEGPRKLLITTERAEPGDVLVAVRDSGPGLAPGALENLFKAFHTTKPNGLGLGLSISRSIVEAHDGRLWASPNAPRGAVFQFTLPALRRDAGSG